MRPEDRRNRAALAVLGVVLLAAGGAGLARGWGAFGAEAARQPVLWGGLRRFVADHRAAFWTAALVVALLVAWTGWRWLRAQLRAAPSISEAELAPFAEGPSTPVRGAALSAAVAADVERCPDVVGARARLAPTGDPFTLHLTVTVADGRPIDRVREHIATMALPRLRQALEVDELDTRVRFETAPPGGRSVV